MKNIETSELRIGNLVSINGKVISIDNRAFHAIINGFEGYDPEPIPLTEEWLVKAGEDLGYTIVIKCNRKKIVFKWGSRVVSTGKRSLWRCYSYRHIKYVHQLQNLYFALTGRELIIK